MISKHGIVVLQADSELSPYQHDVDFPIKNIHYHIVLNAYLVVSYNLHTSMIKVHKNRYGTILDIPADVMDMVNDMIRADGKLAS